MYLIFYSYFLLLGLHDEGVGEGVGGGICLNQAALQSVVHILG